MGSVGECGSHGQNMASEGGREGERKEREREREREGARTRARARARVVKRRKRVTCEPKCVFERLV